MQAPLKRTPLAIIAIFSVLVTLGTVYQVSDFTSLTAGTLAKHTCTGVANIMFTKENFSSTTMTFNTTLETPCKESPYTECGSHVVKNVTSQKMFRISLLRRPSWMSTEVFNLSSCQYYACSYGDFRESGDSDVVVVHGVGLRDSEKPPGRLKKQVYAIQLWESPIHTFSDFIENDSSIWNSQINLIMTYRVDADIFVPYGKLKLTAKPLRERPNYYEIAKKKTRTAVWIVSHCTTHSKRERYVEEMKKYIDVDIFGRCGQPCPIPGSTCTNMTATYKFYLAFENSLCTDYVTEKFFKLFAPGIHVIPVVRGGADYDKYFPNFTYINAAHFKTAKDLALHLKDLASDLKTYSKYLEYKDLYALKDFGIDRMKCKMCEFLHTHNIQENKTYNLKSWLGDGHCRKPQDI